MFCFDKKVTDQPACDLVDRICKNCKHNFGHYNAQVQDYKYCPYCGYNEGDLFDE